MNAFIAWLHANPIWFAAAVTAIHHAFDAAVDSMPQPEPLLDWKYAFFYQFCQKFAGNYRNHNGKA